MDLRERILEAAMKQIAGRSPDALDISRLAKDLGISRQTVYRHLGGKENIKTLLAARMPGNEIHSPDTRQRILESAYRVFASHGFAGATLDRIADDAGLTKGAIYWHFSSKNELFLALLEQRLAKVSGMLPDALRLAAQADQSQDVLADLLVSQLAFAMSDPYWPRLYLEFLAQSREPEVLKRLSGSLSALQRKSASLIGLLQQEGVIATHIRADIAADLITAMLDGIMLNRLWNRQTEDIRVVAKEIAAILWNGLRPADGDVERAGKDGGGRPGDYAGDFG